MMNNTKNSGLQNKKTKIYKYLNIIYFSIIFIHQDINLPNYILVPIFQNKNAELLALRFKTIGF
jgi:hypothetical protein